MKVAVQTISKRFMDLVRETAKITNVNGVTTYEVNKTDLIFDDTGKFLKEVQEDDNKEDKD